MKNHRQFRFGPLLRVGRRQRQDNQSVSPEPAQTGNEADTMLCAATKGNRIAHSVG